jgi:hypothetical protein
VPTSPKTTPRRRAASSNGCAPRPASWRQRRHRPEPPGSAARSVLLSGRQACALLPPATGRDRAPGHSRRPRLAGALQRRRALALVGCPAHAVKIWYPASVLPATLKDMTDHDQQSLFGDLLPTLTPPSRVQQRLIRSAVEIEARRPGCDPLPAYGVLPDRPALPGSGAKRV